MAKALDAINFFNVYMRVVLREQYHATGRKDVSVRLASSATSSLVSLRTCFVVLCVLGGAYFYSHIGYYLKIDEDFEYIISDDLNMESNKVKQILELLVLDDPLI